MLSLTSGVSPDEVTTIQRRGYRHAQTDEAWAFRKCSSRPNITVLARTLNGKREPAPVTHGA